MVEHFEQLEKNVQASFGYVKKDLLMLNDNVSDLQTKISHLSMNHAALLDMIDKLQKAVGKKVVVKGKKKSSKKRK